jgi:site-specific DNA recombinase
LIVIDPQQTASEPDANLVKALIRANEWFGRISRGEVNGSGEVASAERLCRTYVTRVLCLAFLAPEISKAILEGRQPTELTAKRLIGAALHLPLLWADQTALVRPIFPS